ncbi:MAG: recombinase XerD, partial [Dehalococcoidia bacterium]
MTLDESIDQFLEYLEIEKGCAPLTIQVYQHYLKRFSEWLAETSPEA